MLVLELEMGRWRKVHSLRLMIDVPSTTPHATFPGLHHGIYSTAAKVMQYQHQVNDNC